MLRALWLVPACPLLGFVVLALAGRRLPRAAVAFVGVAPVAGATAVAFLVAASFVASPPAGHTYVQSLWQWMAVADFAPRVAFSLDPLSLVMILVVTFVSLMIHLYSVEFMRDDEGYSRFFAYMNLFVASMLTLVLADDLLLLYLGWEGVGMCSYLLIGFWYRDPVNGRAAQKAFLVTRVGDAAMAVGLFLLFTLLGTLNIAELMRRAHAQWPAGSPLACAAAALLLGGAVGKSAQLPLQVWLPDAMAGPTPVSALIHASTMVTAGVYLIARTHVLFTLAPAVQLAVAAIGALTLLLAGTSALVERDIKRVLAYSTISQIGYMFLALGVGAWTAAIFHFMTHAFFKALLFLAAGMVIVRLQEEHDIFEMGGLRTALPTTFWTFLVGSASLAALPLMTAGFYSKDLIVSAAWSSPGGGPWLWVAGVVGALLTSIYIFRVVFVVFLGAPRSARAAVRPLARPTLLIRIPLIVLAVLSIVSGAVEIPPALGGFHPLSNLLESVFGRSAEMPAEPVVEVVTPVVSLLGVYLAYLLFVRRPDFTARLAVSRAGAAVGRVWLAGWGFDRLYDTLLVRPYAWTARVDRDDVVDIPYRGLARLADVLHRLASRTQTGRVRRYATGVVIGAIIVIGLVSFL